MTPILAHPRTEGMQCSAKESRDFLKAWCLRYQPDVVFSEQPKSSLSEVAMLREKNDSLTADALLNEEQIHKLKAELEESNLKREAREEQVQETVRQFENSITQLDLTIKVLEQSKLKAEEHLKDIIQPLDHSTPQQWEQEWKQEWEQEWGQQWGQQLKQSTAHQDLVLKVVQLEDIIREMEQNTTQQTLAIKVLQLEDIIREMEQNTTQQTLAIKVVQLQDTIQEWEQSYILQKETITYLMRVTWRGAGEAEQLPMQTDLSIEERTALAAMGSLKTELSGSTLDEDSLP